MLLLEDVPVAFNTGTANEVRALQHVSLSIADGEFVTVIGANGAGKSSLFNVIAGTAPVDSGRIVLDEHTAALDPHAAGQVIALTRELAESHELTVIMITHSMQQACMLGERIIMMHQGRVEIDLGGAGRRNLGPADLVERFDALEGEACLPEGAPAGPARI